jgi:hypothetical protein
MKEVENLQAAPVVEDSHLYVTAKQEFLVELSIALSQIQRLLGIQEKNFYHCVLLLEEKILGLHHNYKLWTEL